MGHHIASPRRVALQIDTACHAARICVYVTNGFCIQDVWAVAERSALFLICRSVYHAHQQLSALVVCTFDEATTKKQSMSKEVSEAIKHNKKNNTKVGRQYMNVAPSLF